MKYPRESRRVARDQAQSAFAVERLEAIEELARCFKIGLDSEPHLHQLIHFARSAYGERSWSDTGNGQIGTLPWPVNSKITQRHNAKLVEMRVSGAEKFAGNFGGRIRTYRLSQMKILRKRDSFGNPING